MTTHDFEKSWHRGDAVRLLGVRVMVMGIHFGRGLIAFDIGPRRIWLHYKWFKLIW